MLVVSVAGAPLKFLSVTNGARSLRHSGTFQHPKEDTRYLQQNP